MQKKKLIIVGQGPDADWARPHIDSLVTGEALAEENVVRSCEGVNEATPHVWGRDPQLVVFAETPTSMWFCEQLDALWERIKNLNSAAAVAFAPPRSDYLSKDDSSSKLWRVIDRAQRDRGAQNSLYEIYFQVFGER